MSRTPKSIIEEYIENMDNNVNKYYKKDYYNVSYHNLELYSYEVVIAQYIPSIKMYIYEDREYSVTTSRHQCIFLGCVPSKKIIYADSFATPSYKRKDDLRMVRGYVRTVEEIIDIISKSTSDKINKRSKLWQELVKDINFLVR